MKTALNRVAKDNLVLLVSVPSNSEMKENKIADGFVILGAEERCVGACTKKDTRVMSQIFTTTSISDTTVRI